MKVEVNKDACIGCGACGAIAPEVFLVDELAEVILSPVPTELEESVKDAIEGCPTGAIYEIEEEKNEIK